MQEDDLDELAQWHDDLEDLEDLEALCDHMDDLDPSDMGEPKDREWYA